MRAKQTEQMSSIEKRMREFLNRNHGGETTTQARHDLAYYLLGTLESIAEPDAKDTHFRRTNKERVEEIREALEAFKKVTGMTD